MKTKSKPRELSREEFIEREAARCETTPERLLQMVDVIPCHCGHWVCRGWLTEDKKRNPKQP